MVLGDGTMALLPLEPLNVMNLRHPPQLPACDLLLPHVGCSGFSCVRAPLKKSLYVAHLELAIVFINLVLRPLLKLSIFFCFCINKFWGIVGQVIECMHILCKSLGPLGELHELSCLHAHQPRGNMMPPKCCLELIPCDICICG